AVVRPALAIWAADTIGPPVEVEPGPFRVREIPQGNWQTILPLAPFKEGKEEASTVTSYLPGYGKEIELIKHPPRLFRGRRLLMGGPPQLVTGSPVLARLGTQIDVTELRAMNMSMWSGSTVGVPIGIFFLEENTVYTSPQLDLPTTSPAARLYLKLASRASTDIRVLASVEGMA